jgi:symplekin
MQHAAEAAQNRRDEEASRKRERISDEISNVSKKRRVDSAVEGASFTSAAALATANDFAVALSRTGRANPALSAFDVTTLPVALVAELIINNFQVVTDNALANAVEELRRQLPQTEPAAEAREIKQEAPVDPLQMDADEDEELFKASLAVETAAPVTPASSLDTFDLPSPEEHSVGARKWLLRSIVERIAASGVDPASSVKDREISIPLLARLVTRGLNGEYPVEVEQKATIRRILYDFVTEDFTQRWGPDYSFFSVMAKLTCVLIGLSIRGCGSMRSGMPTCTKARLLIRTPLMWVFSFYARV